jgi:hypothetical protein
VSKLTLNKNAAAPATPATDKLVVYLDSDGKLKAKTDAGAVVVLADVVDAVLKTLIDAKGDLLAGTAADAIARLAAGANAQVLSADSAQASGLKWVEPTRDYDFFRQVGTAYERWYSCGLSTNGAPTTYTSLFGKLHAAPYVSGRGGTLDRISINITTAGTVAVGTGLARLGIYKATSLTDLRPGARVLDAGTVDVTTTGVKTININQALDPGQLYWFVICHDCDASDPVMRGWTLPNSMPVLGIDPTMPSSTPLALWEATFTYGALPDPFTAGGALISSGTPMIAVRYSA